MKIKETISIEDFGDTKFKIRIVEAAENRRAIITHYLNNKSNGVSEKFKSDAITYINDFSSSNEIAAEDAIQYLLFELHDVPFPTPKKYDFKFIDLFAGIGGFRFFPILSYRHKNFSENGR